MMTPLEWFAFVILPATLAVVALSASRLFDVFHPIPATSPTSTPESPPALPSTSLPREQTASTTLRGEASHFSLTGTDKLDSDTLPMPAVPWEDALKLAKQTEAGGDLESALKIVTQFEARAELERALKMVRQFMAGNEFEKANKILKQIEVANALRAYVEGAEAREKPPSPRR